MRSIITIILLFFSISAFSQTYYDAKTIKKEYGRISAYNANNILIYQVECDDATWLKFQDGSIKIWDDKKEFTIFSTKLTTPSWASVGDSLNKWMGECVAMSSTPSNLYTTQIDTFLIIPMQINVINSTLSDIRDKLYTTSFDTSTIDTSLYQAVQLQSILDTLTNISSNLLHIYKLDTSQVDTSLVPQKDYTYLLELLASKSYDTSTIDTSLVMPSLTQSLIDSIGKLLSFYPINTLDTSNYCILDSIYQELKAVDTLCFTGDIAVSDSLLRTTVVDCGGTNAISVKLCEGDTTNQFILKDIYKKIDTTNTILNNLYFVGCGENIPIGFIGYKFDNAVDLSCSGGLPSTTEVCDFQHCVSSVPPICIPMSNQAAMQNFINSTLIPDLNTCYGTSLVANDIIYIYNSALDEVEVWYNPTLLAAANPPHNFDIAPIGTGASCEKPFPSIPIATSALSGGDALLVKVCEPLNVVTDTTINATIREMRDSIARQNIILLNQSTPSITATTPSYTTNRTLLTANTTPAAYSVAVPANTREITIQNITGADIQITTSQGTQIIGTMNNITLSNPINTTINHAVFTGNVTISFFSSVLGDISGVAPRVIIDFKAY